MRERVNLIDASGSRGMGGVQVQIGSLVSDVAELRVKLETHEMHHQDEARQRDVDRKEARRYAITTVIAAVAALAGVLALLATHVH